MPFMQRLTWDGVALHAGSVPGYPASHGCIRLPKEFAERLYGVTNYSSTVVLVTSEPVRSAEDARQLA
jgi:lipoprotein-anchoring transpeptidase ErfK/SrfK